MPTHLNSSGTKSLSKMCMDDMKCTTLESIHSTTVRRPFRANSMSPRLVVVKSFSFQYCRAPPMPILFFFAHGADGENVVGSEAKEQRGGCEVVVHRDGHSRAVQLPELRASLQERVKYHPCRASKGAFFSRPEFFAAP